ncbi:MAG: protein kinase domain-containing protein [Planctomycetota bacterium]
MPKIIIKAGRNKGAEFTVVSPRMVVGRRSHCDIQILESKSSREHAEILFDGQEMYVRDLGSRNGTRLNGTPISAKQPLRIGDQIAVGDTVLEVFDASLYKSDLEIPGYKILEGIGKGGMGTVYKAKHLPMDRIVALKVLNARYSHDQAFIDRFIREARAAGQLNHPNVIQVHDVSKVNDLYFFSMEYIDGPSVKDLLRKNGRLEVTQALDIALQAAKALEYAHAKGIIHRDIKPDNLMLTRDGVLKIADLGIAKNFDDRQKEPKDSVMGTPHYMAPEQALGREIDQRADIYSLGAAFYHTLTGQTPFTGDTVQSVIRAHLQEQLPAIQEFNPDVPDPVCFIVERMMAKNPDKRYENMTRVIADIEKARSGMGADIERIQIEDSQIMQAVRPPEKRTWHKRRAVREQVENEEKTDRHAAVRMSGVKVAVIAGAVVLVLGIILIVIVAALSGPPTPKPPPNPGQAQTPTSPTTPSDDPAKQAQQKIQADFDALKTEFDGKASTGDVDLERRLVEFAAAHPQSDLAKQARDLAAQSRDARAGVELRDLQGKGLTGQALIAALDGYLQKFPGTPFEARAKKLRDDAATALASAQTDAWSAEFRAVSDQEKNVAPEDFDQRLRIFNDYLARIQKEKGNPYVNDANQEIAAVKAEADCRLQNAVKSAEISLGFSQFSQAIEEMTRYKQRFHDQANQAKADAEIAHIVGKARDLFNAAHTKAMAHLKSDISSTSAKQDISDVMDRIKGIGTLGDDAKQALSELDAFDRLHALAVQPAVLDNVADRALPPALQLSDKKDLRLAAVTFQQIQLGEGSSGVTIPKNWVDLSLVDRLAMYEYLLKPKDGPMPPKIQADLDLAKAFLNP